MKLIMLPLAFSVAYIAYENRDKIIDQYNAAYPSNPAKEAALRECISRDKNFNRLDGDDRQACYRQFAPPTPVAVVPSGNPYYAYSPSHLPGNDIRRQEATTGYRSPATIPAGEAKPRPARRAAAAGIQHRAAAVNRVAASQPQ